jgi:hypothetical protein
VYIDDAGKCPAEHDRGGKEGNGGKARGIKWGEVMRGLRARKPSLKSVLAETRQRRVVHVQGSRLGMDSAVRVEISNTNRTGRRAR